MATYAELIDDFELEKRIRTIPEDMDLSEYIKQRGGVDYPEEKADGGSIGIEVLFEKKKNGGRIGFQGGGMDASKSDFKSPSSRTYSRSYNPGAGGVVQHSSGGGGGGGPKGPGGPPSIINPPPVIKPPVLTDNFDDRGFLSDVRIKNQKKYLDILNKYKPSDFNTRNIIDGTSNLTEEEANFMDRYGVGKIFNDLSKQNIENFMDIREGVAPKINPSEITSPREYEFAEVTDIDLKRAKEPMTKMMDYDTYKSVNPSSKITPFEFEELKKGNITETGTFTAADGGRVGLFMGGDPLTGQALAIYNSMKAYGEEDQAIADKLQSLGYYDPNASTPPPAVPRKQISQGRGNDQDTTYVDRQDYSFNPANYAPGKQLEINPAAFGMSFEKASKPQGIINAALEMPGRTLTSFASPTTGGNITGPAEEGFMSQVVDIDPAGRTREQLRQQYDSYNRFFGAPSNFAAARTPGKAGQLINMGVGAISGIPFVGPALNALTTNRGDKSLQSKYTVDGAGFGNTGARDEFGLATFDRKDGFLGLTGNTTKDYTDRMNERLGELNDFFSSRIEGFDINNLDDATLDKMKDINGFYTKQIIAYKQRTAVENINKNTQDAIKAQEEAKKKEEAAFQAQLNETQRQQRMSDLQRIERAYREETGGRGGSYATGESGIQRDSAGREVGYNDPFDPGGGEKDGGFIDGYNRRKYSEGGLATMFTRRR